MDEGGRSPSTQDADRAWPNQAAPGSTAEPAAGRAAPTALPTPGAAQWAAPTGARPPNAAPAAAPRAAPPQGGAPNVVASGPAYATALGSAQAGISSRAWDGSTSAAASRDPAPSWTLPARTEVPAPAASAPGAAPAPAAPAALPLPQEVEDGVCAICGKDESREDNQIVYCDGCNVAVHQHCYQLETVPQGSWFCRRCAKLTREDKPVDAATTECLCCSRHGGALVPMQAPKHTYVHYVCAFWDDSLSPNPRGYMQGWGTAKRSANRYLCALCGRRRGTCVHCDGVDCPAYMHVTCAMLDPSVGAQAGALQPEHVARVCGPDAAAGASGDRWVFLCPRCAVPSDHFSFLVTAGSHIAGPLPNDPVLALVARGVRQHMQVDNPPPPPPPLPESVATAPVAPPSGAPKPASNPFVRDQPRCLRDDGRPVTHLPLPEDLPPLSARKTGQVLSDGGVVDMGYDDPRLPARPPGAYSLFCRHHARHGHPQIDPMSAWAKLSPAEQNNFQEEHAQETERYRAAFDVHRAIRRKVGLEELSAGGRHTRAHMIHGRSGLYREGVIMYPDGRVVRASDGRVIHLSADVGLRLGEPARRPVMTPNKGRAPKARKGGNLPGSVGRPAPSSSSKALSAPSSAGEAPRRSDRARRASRKITAVDFGTLDEVGLAEAGEGTHSPWAGTTPPGTGASSPTAQHSMGGLRGRGGARGRGRGGRGRGGRGRGAGARGRPRGRGGSSAGSAEGGTSPAGASRGSGGEEGEDGDEAAESNVLPEFSFDKEEACVRDRWGRPRFGTVSAVLRRKRRVQVRRNGRLRMSRTDASFCPVAAVRGIHVPTSQDTSLPGGGRSAPGVDSDAEDRVLSLLSAAEGGPQGRASTPPMPGGPYDSEDDYEEGASDKEPCAAEVLGHRDLRARGPLRSDQFWRVVGNPHFHTPTRAHMRLLAEPPRERDPQLEPPEGLALQPPYPAPANLVGTAEVEAGRNTAAAAAQGTRPAPAAGAAGGHEGENGVDEAAAALQGEAVEQDPIFLYRPTPGGGAGGQVTHRANARVTLALRSSAGTAVVDLLLRAAPAVSAANPASARAEIEAAARREDATVVKRARSLHLPFLVREHAHLQQSLHESLRESGVEVEVEQPGPAGACRHPAEREGSLCPVTGAVVKEARHPEVPGVPVIALENRTSFKRPGRPSRFMLELRDLCETKAHAFAQEDRQCILSAAGWRLVEPPPSAGPAGGAAGASLLSAAAARSSRAVELAAGSHPGRGEATQGPVLVGVGAVQFSHRRHAEGAVEGGPSELDVEVASLQAQLRRSLIRNTSRRQRLLKRVQREVEPRSQRARERRVQFEYLQLMAWKSIARAMERGVADHEPDFNRVRDGHGALPASWAIGRVASASRSAEEGGQSNEEVAGAAATTAGNEDEEDDAVCQVCFDGESAPCNEIVYCDNCNIALHQRCYGVAVIPEGDFFCDRCAQLIRTGRISRSSSNARDGQGSGVSSQFLQALDMKFACALCGGRDGALKQASDGSWVHLVCALWSPGAVVGSFTSLKPIVLHTPSHTPPTLFTEGHVAALERGEDAPDADASVPRLVPAHQATACACCQKAVGVCVQCCADDCTAAFHPLCAWYAGWFMAVLPSAHGHIYAGGGGGMTFVACCEQHSAEPETRAALVSRSGAAHAEEVAKAVRAPRNAHEQRRLRLRYRAPGWKALENARERDQQDYEQRRLFNARLALFREHRRLKRPVTRDEAPRLVEAVRKLVCEARQEIPEGATCAVCFGNCADHTGCLQCDCCDIYVHRRCYGLLSVGQERRAPSTEAVQQALLGVPTKPKAPPRAGSGAAARAGGAGSRGGVGGAALPPGRGARLLPAQCGGPAVRALERARERGDAVRCVTIPGMRIRIRVAPLRRGETRELADGMDTDAADVPGGRVRPMFPGETFCEVSDPTLVSRGTPMLLCINGFSSEDAFVRRFYRFQGRPSLPNAALDTPPPGPAGQVPSLPTPSAPPATGMDEEEDEEAGSGRFTDLDSAFDVGSDAEARVIRAMHSRRRRHRRPVATQSPQLPKRKPRPQLKVAMPSLTAAGARFLAGCANPVRNAVDGRMVAKADTQQRAEADGGSDCVIPAGLVLEDAIIDDNSKWGAAAREVLKAAVEAQAAAASPASADEGPQDATSNGEESHQPQQAEGQAQGETGQQQQQQQQGEQGAAASEEAAAPAEVSRRTGPLATTFRCERCRVVEPGASCVLCPRRGGALRKMRGGHWAHPACAVLSCTLEDSRLPQLPYPLHVSRPRRSGRFACAACGGRSGVVTTCAHPECTAGVHAMCALLKGGRAVFEGRGGPKVFCPEHAPPGWCQDENGRWVKAPQPPAVEQALRVRRNFQLLDGVLRRVRAREGVKRSLVEAQRGEFEAQLGDLLHRDRSLLRLRLSRVEEGGKEGPRWVVSSPPQRQLVTSALARLRSVGGDAELVDQLDADLHRLGAEREALDVLGVASQPRPQQQQLGSLGEDAPALLHNPDSPRWVLEQLARALAAPWQESGGPRGSGGRTVRQERLLSAQAWDWGRNEDARKRCLPALIDSVDLGPSAAGRPEQSHRSVLRALGSAVAGLDRGARAQQLGEASGLSLTWRVEDVTAVLAHAACVHAQCEAAGAEAVDACTAAVQQRVQALAEQMGYASKVQEAAQSVAGAELPPDLEHPLLLQAAHAVLKLMLLGMCPRDLGGPIKRSHFRALLAGSMPAPDAEEEAQEALLRFGKCSRPIWMASFLQPLHPSVRFEPVSSARKAGRRGSGGGASSAEASAATGAETESRSAPTPASGSRSRSKRRRSAMTRSAAGESEEEDVGVSDREEEDEESRARLEVWTDEFLRRVLRVLAFIARGQVKEAALDLVRCEEGEGCAPPPEVQDFGEYWEQHLTGVAQDVSEAMCRGGGAGRGRKGADGGDKASMPPVPRRYRKHLDDRWQGLGRDMLTEREAAAMRADMGMKDVLDAVTDYTIDAKLYADDHGHLLSDASKAEAKARFGAARSTSGGAAAASPAASPSSAGRDAAAKDALRRWLKVRRAQRTIEADSARVADPFVGEEEEEEEEEEEDKAGQAVEGLAEIRRRITRFEYESPEHMIADVVQLLDGVPKQDAVLVDSARRLTSVSLYTYWRVFHAAHEAQSAEQRPGLKAIDEALARPPPKEGCRICRKNDRQDRILLCDGCNGEYHMHCLNPPLACIPESAFVCRVCTMDGGYRLVGRPIEVYWPQDNVWYKGRIAAFDRTSCRHMVLYEDNDWEFVALATQKFQFLDAEQSDDGSDDDSSPREADGAAAAPADGKGPREADGIWARKRPRRGTAEAREVAAKRLRAALAQSEEKREVLARDSGSGASGSRRRGAASVPVLEDDADSGDLEDSASFTNDGLHSEGRMSGPDRNVLQHTRGIVLGRRSARPGSAPTAKQLRARQARRAREAEEAAAAARAGPVASAAVDKESESADEKPAPPARQRKDSRRSSKSSPARRRQSSAKKRQTPRKGVARRSKADGVEEEEDAAEDAADDRVKEEAEESDDDDGDADGEVQVSKRRKSSASARSSRNRNGQGRSSAPTTPKASAAPRPRSSKSRPRSRSRSSSKRRRR